MLAYFLHVADVVDLPVMLYNFPELAGKRIELETIAAFAEQAQMIAFKQSGAEFEYHRELIALGREKGFVVMSGCRYATAGGVRARRRRARSAGW